ncbi:MAG TPA: metalloregulator ArsR/SmtB family transcription factor [Solimonas sp.]
MKVKMAVDRLGALAQASRLTVFRFLVQHGHRGLCVGDIQTRLKLAPATLSFHLKTLSQAGLLVSRQEGRFIYYQPNFEVMNELIGYLTENCCEGQGCAATRSGC